jgi:hypothetical protein
MGGCKVGSLAWDGHGLFFGTAWDGYGPGQGRDGAVFAWALGDILDRG